MIVTAIRIPVPMAPERSAATESNGTTKSGSGGDYSTFEFGATRDVDSSRRKCFPPYGFTDVGCEEEIDTRGDKCQHQCLWAGL